MLSLPVMSATAPTPRIGSPLATPALVLLNASSGADGSHPTLSQVRDAFTADGLGASVVVGSGDSLAGAARRAVSDGVRLIVAGGGDGTVGAIAAALVGTDAALGILPLGTLNHFAKDLGIPLDLPGAVRVISAGVTRRVDVGEVNGRVFINNSSLGLYPSLVYQREKRQEAGLSKWVAFGLAAARVWRLYRRVRVVVQTDRGSRVVRTPFVFVGNNRYQLEGVRIGARERLDAGRLHVAMAPGMTRGEMLRVLGRALIGRLADVDHFDALLTRELTIAAWRRRLPIALDGEVRLMRTPLRYRVRDAALRVCVPGEANG